MKTRTTELCLAVLAFGALTVALTWPLAAQAGRAVPGDLGDPLFTSWILAWDANAIAAGRSVFDAPMFHPEPLTLAISENLLGLALPLAPVWWLTHDAALVNTVALLVSFTLNGAAAYALARCLGAGWQGAGVAGFVFAFAPYRIAQITHVHVEATWWIPLMLLLVVRLVERPAWWRGAAVGLVLGLQVWTSLNGGVVAGIALGLAAPVAAWNARGRLKPVLAGLGLAVVVAGVTTAPLVAPFIRARQAFDITVDVEDAEEFSADPASLLIVSRTDRLLADPTFGLRKGPYSEKTLYPGVAVVVLAAIGTRLWWRTRRPVVAGAAVLGVGSLVLSLGPEVSDVPMPYAWAAEIVPLVANLRVPTRVWPLVLLSLGVLAARAVPRRTVVFLAVATLLVVDYLAAPIEMAPLPDVPPGYEVVRSEPGAVLELPALVFGQPASLFNETTALYRQTRHWQPLVNGYSSMLPGSYLGLMGKVASFPDADSRRALAERGVRWVVIHPGELENTPWERLPDALDERVVRYRSAELIVVEVVA